MMDILEIQNIPRDRKTLIALISDARRNARKRRMMRLMSLACVIIGSGILWFTFAPHSIAKPKQTYQHSYLAEVKH